MSILKKEKKNNADVIVIAGTQDAREIIDDLLNLGMSVAATVTTKFGNELIEEHPNLQVFTRMLTVEGMVRLIEKYDTHCIIDASHPFAVEVSQNAMKACKRSEISYIRYERALTKLDDPNIIRVQSYDEAILVLKNVEGNILLTTGSKNLEPFLKIPSFQDRLFVRVLPESGVLEKCEKLGFTAKNIIAMKGPFSEELNAELIKHCEAKILFTKDSGEVGGTEEKIKAALNLGIKIMVLDRPEVEYTEKASTIGELLYKVSKVIEEV